MSEANVNLDRLAQLIHLVETRGLKKLVVEEEGCRYEIIGTGDTTSDADSLDPAEYHKPSDSDDASDRIAVTSPMAGVFFRGPAPGEPPFVQPGDRVEEGQTIGIIEAMKVFSEIPSPYSGVVDDFAVSDAELVRSGQVLLYLKADGDEDTDSVGDN